MTRGPSIRIAAACAILINACLIGCVLLGPSWRDVRDLATTPQQFTQVAGADRVAVVLVGILLWILCGWLTLAIACCAGATLPGRSGRTFGGIGALISPRLVRRALGFAVGISLTPAVAQNAVAQDVVASAPAYAVVAVTGLPQGDGALLETAGVDWPVEPTAPESAITIAVHPGDCLWSLVESHLGYGATIAEVSQEVDRWWDANAEVIGADPDLLIPGQVLVVPPT